MLGETIPTLLEVAPENQKELLVWPRLEQLLQRASPDRNLEAGLTCLSIRPFLTGEQKP